MRSVEDCPALKPLNYQWNSDIVLQVDMSWRAIGTIGYQLDPDNPKKKYFTRFVSIMFRGQLLTTQERTVQVNESPRGHVLLDLQC
jgi:hypothetical protein